MMARLLKWVLMMVCWISTQGLNWYQFNMINAPPIDIKMVPYQAILQKGYVFACGGSIIHKHYILSAAHCVTDIEVDPKTDINNKIETYQLRIQLGTNIANEGGVIYEVKSLARHHKFPLDSDAIVMECDIALIRTKKSIKFTPSSKIIKLINREPTSKDMAFVSGYGQQKAILAHRKEVHDLRGAHMPIVDRAECKRKHAKFNDSVITGDMICAGLPKGIKDACSGDSGGPLAIVLNDKSKMLAGIVSWGQGCGNEGIPGVYTNIVVFKKWIDDKMKLMEAKPKPKKS